MGACARALADRRFLASAVVWGVGSLVAFGLVSVIIPNPVFGRQIPPEPFAIAVWIASAPLMGLVAATYMTPAASWAEPSVLGGPLASGAAVATTPAETRGTTLGTLAWRLRSRARGGACAVRLA